MTQKVAPAHPLENRILLQGFGDPESWKIKNYEAIGGYTGAKKAMGLDRDAIINEVKASGLRGLGGAGFPTGVKWGFISKTPTKPVYLVVNGDEGEPGTFKDRQLLEHLPHRLIEGMIIAARAIGSQTGYIYIRGELSLAIERCHDAVQEAYAAGYLGENVFGSGAKFDITVHLGAGAYICGEETALIESLEGDRGQPRLKPPFPAIAGAFGGPTIVNNVETLCSVPGIINNGADWYLKLGLGTPRAAGTRVLCVSGDVQRPGFYEVQNGINLNVLLNEICGGPLPGRQFKSCYPGGSSSPVLKADEFDVKMDFDSLAAKGTMAGSGAIVVMDDRRSMAEMALRTARFYAHESCGQCVPCREGTKWVYTMIKRLVHGHGRRKDVDDILDACSNMAGKTICVLSDACAMPVTSLIKKFPHEFEALARPDSEVAPALPKVSGQMSGLMNAIRERQKQA